MLQALYGLDAEIIALSEVDINAKRYCGAEGTEYYEGGSNQVKYLAEQLTEKTGVQHYWAFSVDLNNWSSSDGAAHPDMALEDIYGGGWIDPAYTQTNQALYGNAIISKYPIVSCRQLQVWAPEHSFKEDGTNQAWIPQVYYCSSQNGDCVKNGDICTLTTAGHNDLYYNGTEKVSTSSCCSTHSKSTYCSYLSFLCNHKVSASNPCVREDHKHETASYERKSVLIAEIDVNGTIVTVLSTHYGLRHSEQVAATNAILAELEKIDTPVILAGDLNSGFGYDVNAYDNDLALLQAAGLNANITASNKPVTFQSGSTIDYIMTSAGLVAETVRSDTTCKASDHYPIFTKVALNY